MKTLIGVIAGLGLVTVLAGEGSAMTCAPTDVPVKLVNEAVDVNGNVYVKGLLGCAQSATPEGRVRVLVTRLNVTQNGAPSATVVEIHPLPSEIVAR